MPELRQRKNKAATGADAAAGPDTASSTAFSQQQQNDRNRRNLDAASEQVMRKKRPSFIGRFLLFIGLPTVMGFCGMFISYLSNVAEGKSDASLIDFDKDFVFPFMRKFCGATFRCPRISHHECVGTVPRYTDVANDTNRYSHILIFQPLLSKQTQIMKCV